MSKKARLVKGSLAAKRHMAKLRKLAVQKRKSAKPKPIWATSPTGHGEMLTRAAQERLAQLPSPSMVEVKVWEERDRLHIELRHKFTGKTIAEWWDDDARQMFEDGFFKVTGPQMRGLDDSVIKYAQEMGLLANGNPLYVGLKSGKREVFRHPSDPTVQSHGDKYGAVVGPFRTKAAAELMAGPHGPLIQTVSDAERAVRSKSRKNPDGGHRMWDSWVSIAKTRGLEAARKHLETLSASTLRNFVAWNDHNSCFALFGADSTKECRDCDTVHANLTTKDLVPAIMNQIEGEVPGAKSNPLTKQESRMVLGLATKRVREASKMAPHLSRLRTEMASHGAGLASAVSLTGPKAHRGHVGKIMTAAKAVIRGEEQPFRQLNPLVMTVMGNPAKNGFARKFVQDLKPGDKQAIRNIVAGFHTETPEESLATFVAAKLRGKPTAAQRAAVMEYAIQCHRANQKLAGDVTRGMNPGPCQNPGHRHRNPVDYQDVYTAAQKVGYSVHDAARVASAFKRTGEMPRTVEAQLRYFKLNPLTDLEAKALMRQTALVRMSPPSSSEERAYQDGQVNAYADSVALFGPKPMKRKAAMLRSGSIRAFQNPGTPAGKLLMSFIQAEWEADYYDEFADKARLIVKEKTGSPWELSALRLFLRKEWTPDFASNFAEMIENRFGIRHNPRRPNPFEVRCYVKGKLDSVQADPYARGMKTSFKTRDEAERVFSDIGADRAQGYRIVETDSLGRARKPSKVKKAPLRADVVGVEIEPVKVWGGRASVVDDLKEANRFSVYFRTKKGPAEWVKDFSIHYPNDALRFANELALKYQVAVIAPRLPEGWGALVPNRNPVEGWVVTKDGETIKTFPGATDDFPAAQFLHTIQGQSIDYAVRHGGYDIVCVRGGKIVHSYKRDMQKKRNPSPKIRWEVHSSTSGMWVVGPLSQHEFPRLYGYRDGNFGSYANAMKYATAKAKKYGLTVTDVTTAKSNPGVTPLDPKQYAGQDPELCASCGESLRHMGFREGRALFMCTSCGAKYSVKRGKAKRQSNPRLRIEYKRVDTTTLQGLRQAERLHQAGWKQGQVTPFSIQFYRKPSPDAVDRERVRRGMKPLQKPQANPRKGTRRKVTMTLEAFAKMVKAKNDPKLWSAFMKKVQDYKKWSHGTLPKKVTVEQIDVPGMSGMWMTYDAGKAPETAYVMPSGTKRKGAWVHQWDTMPDIKNDPDTGIVLTKLKGKSRITDFYHR